MSKARFAVSGGVGPIATKLGFSLYVDDMDSLGLIANGIYEADEVELCRWLVRPGDCVLDIGANIGFYTVWLAGLTGPRGKVIAFEPDLDNAALLERNIALNACGNVRIVPMALSDDAGSATLYRCEFNAGMHRLYPSVCCAGDGESVGIARGDDLALGRVDFIKIDIEGFEPRAIAGLAGTIRSNPQLAMIAEFSPLALMEAGTSPNEYLRILRSLGLRAFALQNGLWRPVDYDVLADACHVFEAQGFREYLSGCTGLPKSQLWERTERYLAGVGYERPYYESLLLLGAQRDDSHVAGARPGEILWSNRTGS